MNKLDSVGLAYLSIISEAPMINHDLTPELIGIGAKSMREVAAKKHSSAKNLGNDYYRINHGSEDSHINYHHTSDGPKEISYISKNIQVGVDKGDGDVKHIHNLMKRHIQDFGRLSTDKTNTPGSRKMWIDFVKKNPKVNFHIEKTENGSVSRQKVDHTNIDELKDKIWGDAEDFKNIRLVGTK